MAEATGDLDALLRRLDITRDDGIHAVLFDFDGPVCDLFGGASTAMVADEVKRAAEEHWGTLDPDVEACDDSHGILRRLRDKYDRPAPQSRSRLPLELAEKIVEEQETQAVKKAVPAPDIVPLVDLLRARRMRLVIVSNNAKKPIQEYLDRPAVGLRCKFEDVFGRDPYDARHMKPDPDCVNRALEHLSLRPSSCLLVGDQLTDLKAARSAGTWFLGYTQDGRRAPNMKQEGADAVVSSHRALIETADRLLGSGWPLRRAREVYPGRVEPGLHAPHEHRPR
jgi:phosphoglycolate phosphatase